MNRTRPQPIVRKVRVEDPEGKITGIVRTADKLMLSHSKLGDGKCVDICSVDRYGRE